MWLCVCIEARWDRFVLNGPETVLFLRFPVTFDSSTLICGFPRVQLTNACVTIRIIFILQSYLAVCDRDRREGLVSVLGLDSGVGAARRAGGNGRGLVVNVFQQLNCSDRLLRCYYVHDIKIEFHVSLADLIYSEFINYQLGGNNLCILV